MKLVYLLFDSLNRSALQSYGGRKIATPNFDRLAAKTTAFDKHHVGSMPCMPARRDMLTGRLSFLHRSWGPIEPFDITFPERLAEITGTYSHLITDHFHYWEDGGATYHSRYDTHQFFRGQEGDRWQAVVSPDWPSLLQGIHPKQRNSQRRNYKAQNILNRDAQDRADTSSTRQCVEAGLDFLVRNKTADNWFLQIECFDPHEPFYVPKAYRAGGEQEEVYDWPLYGKVDDLPEDAAKLREGYYAAVRYCDDQLGLILDHFDAEQLWDDTALIVTTDHGFLLGEHDFWGKNRMTLYDEIARIPLFFHDPAMPTPGARCAALSQTTDLAATFYDLFGCPPPSGSQSISLRSLVRGSAQREAVIFGYFGGAVNITDGRYSYHRYPEDPTQQELFQYTLMPTHIHSFFSIEELAQASLHEGFAFTQGAKLLRIPYLPSTPMNSAYGPGVLVEWQTALYDLEADPDQSQRIEDAAIEKRLSDQMVALMKAQDAPVESYKRIGLSGL
jgi:arylsulfatase A-like enzyme